MRLPNPESTFVEESKILDYLLNEEKSGGKTGFFLLVGFTISQWELLRKALLDHAARYEVTRVAETSHGTKYIIEGTLLTPSGRQPYIRSVWIVDLGKDAARFVTAYPLRGQEE